MYAETTTTNQTIRNLNEKTNSDRRNRFAMTLVALIVAVATLTMSAGPAAASVDLYRLGYRWDVSVSNGWSAIFTRRDISGAISNQYDVVWYHPTHGEIRSDMRIHLDVRDGLILQRRDLTGPQAGRSCRGTGYLDYAAGMAYGTMGCDWAPAQIPWSARTWR